MIDEGPIWRKGRRGDRRRFRHRAGDLHNGCWQKARKSLAGPAGDGNRSLGPFRRHRRRRDSGSHADDW